MSHDITKIAIPTSALLAIGLDDPYTNYPHYGACSVWHADHPTSPPYTLRQDYSEEHLRIIEAYGIDMPRLSNFIQRTRAVGGVVARLTLCLACFIMLFREDSDAEFVISCVAYGVDMDYTPPDGLAFFRVANYVSDGHVEKVTVQIQKEIREGRIVRTTIDRVIGISAIGAVRKGVDGIRIVNDYSRPVLQSVNSGIATRKESFAKVSHAAKLLRPRALHCKVDITEAYRSYPMAEAWWSRHAFEWQGVLYSDLRMPFGNSGAPSAFHRFSTAFARLIMSHDFPAVVAYLDDFWLSA
jgi:hypothetical protein